jgi:hypothetical protein
MELSKRLMQSRDRQLAGVKLTLSGNCWTSLVDPEETSRPTRKGKGIPPFASVTQRPHSDGAMW